MTLVTKLAKYEKKLRSFTPERQKRDLLNIIKRYQDMLVDLNTLQLLSGKDTDGLFLSPPYASKSYAELKLFMNPNGVVDLFFTGDFHRSIFVRVDKFPITFDARDKKKKQLQEKYGKILGLTEESKQKFREYIEHEIREYYERIYKL